jgi:hypothetical protein
MKNNQEFIGMLLSSYKSKETNYINIIIRSGVNKTLVKKLADYYKFTIEDDKQSVIEKTISEVSKEIVNCLWVPVGDVEQVSPYVNKDGYLIIPNTLNDIIVNYVEFVNRN